MLLEVLLPAVFLIGLLAVMILAGVRTFQAVERRTLDASSRSIMFGLVVSLGTVLLAFALVYLSAWTEMRQQIASGQYDAWTRYDRRGTFLFAKRALSEYASNHEGYPDSIENTPELEECIRLDPWHRPYVYHKTKDGFSLLSLGRDGKPGGIGLDADFYLDEQGGPPIEPTISQFLFEAEGGGTLLVVALFASFFAGLVCYLASGSPANGPMRIFLLMRTFIITAVGAVVVSLFLVSIYLFGLPH